MDHPLRTRFRRPMALAGLLLAPLALAGCGPSGGDRRVVLITIDTLRADYVGCYGSQRVRTPTLDGLAGSGARFETAISPTPMTRPSHASIMTGLAPSDHGVHDNARFQLDEEIPTLAEAYRDAGFETAAFVAALVLDRNSGLARGFDVYDDRMDDPPAPGGSGSPVERSASQVVDRALAWLEDAPDSFFLWVHFYDPHADYLPPPGYAPTQPRELPIEEQGFLRAFAGYLPADYAGEVSFSDAQAGRLLRAIDERWDASGTLVAVTSDHGESLGEHGELTHSLTVYDATQRVPLLLAGPGVAEGVVVSAPVTLVDLAPTLLSLSGLPPLAGGDGRDLRELLTGREAGPGAPAYLETLRPRIDYGWSPIYGLRSERYKYLRSPIPELYDLAADPGELNNIASEQPARVQQLDAELQRHFEGARALRQNTSVDAEQQSLLASLGYVSHSSEAMTEELGWVGGPDVKARLPAIIALTEANWHLDNHRPARALAALASSPPASGWVALTRSRAVLALGRPAEAERLAREMIDAQPETAEGFVALGEALEALGRTAEAGDAFREAERLGGAPLDAILGLGRVAEAEGDREAAEGFYRQLLESASGSVDAAYRLAALQLEAGRSDEALALLQRIGDAPGKRPDAVIRLARAETAAGYWREALARLRAVIERGNEAPAVRGAFRELRAQARRTGRIQAGRAGGPPGRE